MTNISPEILEQALNRLKAGSSLEEVLSLWPEHRQELDGLLQASLLLSSLPKKSVPEPAMQRRYIEAPVRKLWFAWLHVSKLASISAAGVLLFTALAGTGYAAYQSVPGQTLFGIKKTAERVHLKLTLDPVEKANLQMEIAKKRIAEAEQVFKNPQREPKQELAALNELSSETKKTIEAVDTVTKTVPDSINNGPIVASLENLTKQQQTLLEEIKPSAEFSDATKTALKTNEENVTKVAEIKRYLEAAAYEQSLAKLENEAAEATASGTPEQIEVPQQTLPVIGKSVQGVSTSTPKTQASSTLPGDTKVEPENPVVTEETSQTSSSTAVGTFIIEDPQPQSAF